MSYEYKRSITVKCEETISKPKKLLKKLNTFKFALSQRHSCNMQLVVEVQIMVLSAKIAIKKLAEKLKNE